MALNVKPHLPAAAPTTKTLPPVFEHLHAPAVVQLVDHRARRFGLAVRSAKVAGIMKRDSLGNIWADPQ
jgi:hypothetical protein